MYKDRYGKRIKAGSVVAAAITINHDTFKGFNFETTVCRKRGCKLILDGVHGWRRLSESDARELAVIDAETDLTNVYVDFARAFPRPRL